MTMLDLPAALRAAGLRVWVAPDWRTNGHDIKLLDKPYGGVLHHTGGHSLQSVYGEPDWRPEVPQPRANIFTPIPDTVPWDVAVVCAGRAWHAGANNSQAHADLAAGRFNARIQDAATRFGPNSDQLDAGYTSAKTVGNEIEWFPGDKWTDRQLDVVAITMNVCVDVFGWPGVGSWAHHRQLTFRKTDMDYRGDIWSRATQLRTNSPKEFLMSLSDKQQAELYEFIRGTKARVEHIEKGVFGPLLDDEAKLSQSFKDAVANIKPTLSDSQLEDLATRVARKILQATQQ